MRNDEVNSHIISLQSLETIEPCNYVTIRHNTCQSLIQAGKTAKQTLDGLISQDELLAKQYEILQQ